MSCLSQLGSTSDSDRNQRIGSSNDAPFSHGEYHILRFYEEPFDHRRLQMRLGPEKYLRWQTLKDFRILRNQSIRPSSAPDLFPLPVSAIAALRTSSESSNDSDDSHCSTPDAQALVQASDGCRAESTSPEADSDWTHEEDAFEELDAAIIDVLAPDFRLASGVIAHLYKLPPHLRAFVYGFAGNQAGGDNILDPRLGSIGDTSALEPEAGLEIYKPLKRKRAAAGNDILAEDDTQARKSRSKQYWRSMVDELKYACPFNIYDHQRFCVRNEKGGTGAYYLPCMGPGFTDPRHMKDHFASCHRIPQCQRCWQKFDSPYELSYHRDKMEPRCQDRTEFIHEKESLTEIEWTKIEAALAVPRSKKGKQVVRKNDRDRWFDVWRIIFPQETYPDLPTPEHPYYVDPNMLSKPLPTYSETERMIEIVKAIWDKKIQDVKGDDKYQPTQEDVFQMMREAASITARVPNGITNLTSPPNADHPEPSLPSHDDTSTQPQTGDQANHGASMEDEVDIGGVNSSGPATTYAIDAFGTAFENFDWTTWNA